MTLAALVATAAVAAAASALATSARATVPPGPCTPWTVTTVLSGQGWLENLAFEPRGSLTLSALSKGKLLRLRPSGALTTLVGPVNAPGGQRVRGRYLYYNTGDTIPVAPTGTVDRLDLRTGRSTVWAHGLSMPNGLALLPNGDAVVTGEVPARIGLTRISARRPGHPHFGWARIAGTNGITVDPSGRWLYVDRDPPVRTDGEVDRVSIAHPREVRVVGHLGTGSFPDDMTVSRQGILYIAGFQSGDIYRLDPRTHRSCAIAGGLQNPTSVKFGGARWPVVDLYVTSAQGGLYRLAPPSGRR